MKNQMTHKGFNSKTSGSATVSLLALHAEPPSCALKTRVLSIWALQAIKKHSESETENSASTPPISCTVTTVFHLTLYTGLF